MCWGTTEHMGVQVQVVGSWGTQSWGAQGWGCAALEAHGTGGVWGLYIGNISAEYVKQMWILHYQLGWDSWQNPDLYSKHMCSGQEIAQGYPFSYLNVSFSHLYM